MTKRVFDQTEDALAEMCWCGHDYRHHTDSETPVCYYPWFPDEDGFDWEAASECPCDGWWPMNEDPPEDIPHSGRT